MQLTVDKDRDTVKRDGVAVDDRLLLIEGALDTLLVPVELQLRVGVAEVVPVLWLRLFVPDLDNEPTVQESVEVGWKE